jgi:hypothetical protein
MGGYGSGRPQTRPSATESLAFGVQYPAALLAELRRERAGGDDLGQLVRVMGWTHGAARASAGSVLYTVGEDVPGRPWCELRYSAGGLAVAERLQLVERPSNLGRGAVPYWRCTCGQLARVLYNPRGRWRCRRCTRVVYDSSRESDARVSALLAAAARGAHLDHVTVRDADLLGTLAAGELLRAARADMGSVMLSLKALDRIGMGIGLSKPARWHGSAGRPRARR